MIKKELTEELVRNESHTVMIYAMKIIFCQVILVSYLL